MKVEKIEIKKELMEIPDHQYYVDFAVIPPITAMAFIKEGEVPTENLTGQKITYQVERVKFPGEDIRNYLVRMDDKKLFNDLIKITDNILEAAVKEKTEKYVSQVEFTRKQAIEEIRMANYRVATRIKKLPWWKRLFNQF